jgi:hypothetical protein
VLATTRQWLALAPWQTVLSTNQSLCQAKELTPNPNEKGYDVARRLWEQSAQQPLALSDVLDLCRKCHQLGPFTFNNGNTFAAVGQTLIADYVQALPPVEAQILRNTVGHYIVGMVGKKELHNVFHHFETAWRIGS